MNDIIESITNFIFCKDELKKSDIIIIPGTTRAEVPIRAAELYKKDFSRCILACGCFNIKKDKFPFDKIDRYIYKNDYNSEAEFIAEVLAMNGIPSNSILIEEKSRNTRENAIFSRQKLVENNILIKNAIICCQSFHARRVKTTFSLVFPEVNFYICPVDTQNISATSWYDNTYSIETVMGELEKCGKYFANDIYKLKNKGGIL